MELASPRQIFEKYSNIKCYENPSNGGCVVPCGQKDGRTVMTKLIVAISNFANAPKTSEMCHERSIGEANFEFTYLYNICINHV